MKKPLGFTLVEMAVVLAIIGLLLGGLLVTLSAQIEQRKLSDTQKRLDDVKEALLGFAAANGRLPCPASSTSNGVEDPINGSGTCTHPYDGFVPAVTLGLTPTDSQGYMLDGWETPQNRIRYAVWTTAITAVAYPFTSPNGMKSVGISKLSTTLLRVCADSANVTSTTPPTCGTSIALTNNAPVVLYSLGSNALTGSHGDDELANLNNDSVFVSHEPTTDFDDIVTWLSVNTLFNRMIAAGQLP